MSQLTEALYDQYKSRDPFSAWTPFQENKHDLEIEISKTSEKSFLIIKIPCHDFIRCRFEIYDNNNYQYCGELNLEDKAETYLTCPYFKGNIYFVKVSLESYVDSYYDRRCQGAYLNTVPKSKKMYRFFGMEDQLDIPDFPTDVIYPDPIRFDDPSRLDDWTIISKDIPTVLKQDTDYETDYETEEEESEETSGDSEDSEEEINGDLDDETLLILEEGEIENLYRGIKRNRVSDMSRFV